MHKHKTKRYEHQQHVDFLHDPHLDLLVAEPQEKEPHKFMQPHASVHANINQQGQTDPDLAFPNSDKVSYWCFPPFNSIGKANYKLYIKKKVKKNQSSRRRGKLTVEKARLCLQSSIYTWRAALHPLATFLESIAFSGRKGYDPGMPDRAWIIEILNSWKSWCKLGCFFWDGVGGLVLHKSLGNTHEYCAIQMSVLPRLFRKDLLTRST